MRNIFNLTWLHLCRMIRIPLVLASLIIIPLGLCVLSRIGFHVPRSASYAIIILFAAVCTVVQAAADKSSGLSEGLRTTPAPDYAINLSRLLLIPVLAVPLAAIMGIGCQLLIKL